MSGLNLKPSLASSGCINKGISTIHRIIKQIASQIRAIPNTQSAVIGRLMKHKTSKIIT